MFVMGSLLGLLVAAGAVVGMLPATSTPLHDDAPDAEEAQAGTPIEPLPDDAAAADIPAEVSDGSQPGDDTLHSDDTGPQDMPATVTDGSQPGDDTIISDETGPDDVLAVVTDGSDGAGPGASSTASEGADTLLGDLFADEIDGGEGSDQINGYGGGDLLQGGEGSDSLAGSEGSDTLKGGAGADTLEGGDGDDLLDAGAGDDTLSGGFGADTLLGGAGQDHLIGGADNDRLEGGAGNDTLEGAAGDDSLSGGAAQDDLSGGAGDDLLDWRVPDAHGHDTDGREFLNGGAGDDTVIRGADDWLSGNEGHDTFAIGGWIDPAHPATIADYAPGQDHLVLVYDGASPHLSIEPSETDGAAWITANGTRLAEVLNAGGLIAADVLAMTPAQLLQA